MTTAYVMGSSLAGLLSAAALAKHHDRVVVIERDETVVTHDPRRGIPQGRHAHILLQSGEHAIEKLLPGFSADYRAAGAKQVDFGEELQWFHHGVWKKRYKSGFKVHAASRPLLESVVNKHVTALGNITIRRGETVEGLAFDKDNTRVTGVIIKGQVEPADVVIDAGGRGSQVALWLQNAGFAPPPEARIKTDLRYISRYYRAPDEAPPWTFLAIYPDPTINEHRMGFIFPIEGKRWLVTMGGYHNDHAHPEAQSYMNFAQGLSHPLLSQYLANAEPLSEPVIHNFPYAIWRRWYAAKQFPKGLLIVGDASCSFDPVFGQGMAVAARNGLLVSEHLEDDPTVENPRGFFRRQALLIFVPWLLSASEDFRFKEAEGTRIPGLPLLQAYTAQIMKLCSVDTAVYGRFLRVLHLVDGPQSLFAPSVIAKVLWRMLTKGKNEKPFQPALMPAKSELAAKANAA